MDSWSGCGSQSSTSQTKVVGGKQNSEKVAWFYQPNYTKLAALLLIERQRKSSPANKNHQGHREQDLSDKDGNSDSDSCSSGKENNCDNSSSSSSTFVSSDVSSNPISSNNSPFFPPQEESVSSSIGDDIASERANFIRSRRSQPISRSGSSETQSSSSSLIAGLQQSDLEKELEMVKEREDREQREQKEKETEIETDVKSMDTQMSDLEVAEELLSLVRVSASLPYAPIKNESTDFKPTTTSIIKTETKKEKENFGDKELQQVNSDVHGNAAIPSAIPNTRQLATLASSSSSATNNSTVSNNNISTTGSGGPYRRRTNACLEHKRKHQKCPYDCIYKKRAQSPPNGSTSIPTSPPTTTTTLVPSTPTVASAQSPAPKVYESRSPSPSSSPSPTSPTSPTLLPSDSQSNTLIADTSPQSVSQTYIITPHKEFSSLVTKFLSFGMNVPPLNTFGTQTHLPTVSVPSPMVEPLFPKMS